MNETRTTARDHRLDTAAFSPILSGRKTVEAAQALCREFGDDAGMAAALRAAQSRARDNAISFCHWREVERLVGWMADGDATGAGTTRH